MTNEQEEEEVCLEPIVLQDATKDMTTSVRQRLELERQEEVKMY